MAATAGAAGAAAAADGEGAAVNAAVIASACCHSGISVASAAAALAPRATGDVGVVVDASSSPRELWPLLFLLLAVPLPSSGPDDARLVGVVDFLRGDDHGDDNVLVSRTALNIRFQRDARGDRGVDGSGDTCCCCSFKEDTTAGSGLE